MFQIGNNNDEVTLFESPSGIDIKVLASCHTGFSSFVGKDSTPKPSNSAMGGADGVL